MGQGPGVCQISGGRGLPRVGSPGAAGMNDHTMGLNTKSILLQSAGQNPKIKVPGG